MILIVGIGTRPAMMVLFGYYSMPIVRNTLPGSSTFQWIVPMRRAVGLPAAARLTRLELPLGAPTIMARIKTSTVIDVSTATAGGLSGAGGFGQPIFTAIRLGDPGLIGEDAMPAAIPAILVQGGFGWTEKYLCRRGFV